MGFEKKYNKLMKSIKKEAILKRMNYLTGHLNGVKKMIKEDKYCIDIIKQNMAVTEAIKKVNGLILESHLKNCVMAAIKGSKESERKKKLDELLKIFEMSKK